MITKSAEEFRKTLSPMRPLLGLDLGTKTIGCALSDRLHAIGSSARLIIRKKFTVDAAEIQSLIHEHDIGGIVLGWPLNMDGSEGPRTQSTLAFAHNLVKLWGEDCPAILLWDERLSTVSAERALLEADLSRKKRAKSIDALAAAVILQAALDRLAVIGANHG